MYAVASRMMADPRWRWVEGMAMTHEPKQNNPDHDYFNTCRVVRTGDDPLVVWRNCMLQRTQLDGVPDLTDTATLGAVIALGLLGCDRCDRDPAESGANHDHEGAPSGASD